MMGLFTEGPKLLSSWHQFQSITSRPKHAAIQKTRLPSSEMPYWIHMAFINLPDLYYGSTLPHTSGTATCFHLASHHEFLPEMDDDKKLISHPEEADGLLRERCDDFVNSHSASVLLLKFLYLQVCFVYIVHKRSMKRQSIQAHPTISIVST